MKLIYFCIFSFPYVRNKKLTRGKIFMGMKNSSFNGLQN